MAYYLLEATLNGCIRDLVFYNYRISSNKRPPMLIKFWNCEVRRLLEEDVD